MHTKFWLEYLKGREDAGDIGVAGRIILEWVLGNWGGKLWTGFIRLDRDRWRTPVNSIMNLQIL